MHLVWVFWVVLQSGFRSSGPSNGCGSLAHYCIRLQGVVNCCFIMYKSVISRSPIGNCSEMSNNMSMAFGFTDPFVESNLLLIIIGLVGCGNRMYLTSYCSNHIAPRSMSTLFSKKYYESLMISNWLLMVSSFILSCVFLHLQTRGHLECHW